MNPINRGINFIVYNLKMNRNELDAVGLVMQNYLKKTDKSQKEQQTKLRKISEMFSRQGWHKKFIHLLFAVFKKIIKKDNLAICCKKTLAFIDQLLQKDRRNNIMNGYRVAISQSIVEYYTFIFPLIFEYRNLDLILDFKVYRMLWAKDISDKAFDNIRNQIKKSHKNFDVSRGFSEEALEKIKKSFSNKHFTEEQIQRYMNGENQPEFRRSQSSPSRDPSRDRYIRRQSSDDEESDTIRKQVKTENLSSQMPSQYAVMHNQFNGSKDPYNYPNMYPNNYPMQNNQFPPRQAQNIPPTNNPNYMMNNNLNSQYGYARNYPPQQNLNNNGAIPMVPLPNMHQVPIYHTQNIPPPPQTQPYYQDMKNNGFPYQQFNNPPTNFNRIQPRPSPPLDIPQAQTNDYKNPYFRMKSPSPQIFPKKQTPNFYQPQSKPEIKSISIEKPSNLEKQKYKMLLENLKKGLVQCRQCGMNFLSSQNLENHQMQHFSQAEKKFHMKQAQNQGIQKLKHKPQNFDMLCDVNQWILEPNDKGEHIRYIVSINRLPTYDRDSQHHFCFYCNEEMSVIWSDKLQQWALEDCVKVQEPIRGICVAHYDCFEHFKPEENSLPYHPLISN